MLGNLFAFEWGAELGDDELRVHQEGQGPRHRCGFSTATTTGGPCGERRCWPGQALLGLDGVRVLEETEADVEVIIDIESTAELAGCGECGVRAEAQDRMPVEIRSLACFGRATRLV